MRKSALLVALVAGLGFLTPGLGNHYILVDSSLSWADARAQCQADHIDLAIVNNIEDLQKLNELDQTQSFWIGLQGGTGPWKWSVNDQGEVLADTGYRNWGSGQPINTEYFKQCALMDFYQREPGKWLAKPCDWVKRVTCYTGDLKNVTHLDAMSWYGARDYCRKFHTDLLFIKDQADNDFVSPSVLYDDHWIGLYRDSWEWADRSTVTITNWGVGKPDGNGQQTCVVSSGGTWSNVDCASGQKFACSTDYLEQKVVKVVVRSSQPTVNMVELQDGILEKLRQSVEHLQGDGYVSLSWRRQPDGSIFSKETKDTQEDTGVDTQEDDPCPAYV